MFVPTPATTAPDTVDVGDVAGKITLFIDPGSTGPPEARAARSGARRPAPHPPACTCLVPVRYPRAAVIGSRFTHEARARSTRTKHAGPSPATGGRVAGGRSELGVRYPPSARPPACACLVPLRYPCAAVSGHGPRTKHAHGARGPKPGNRWPGGLLGGRSSELGARYPPKARPPACACLVPVRYPRAAIAGSRVTHEARARSTRARSPATEIGPAKHIGRKLLPMLSLSVLGSPGVACWIGVLGRDGHGGTLCGIRR